MPTLIRLFIVLLVLAGLVLAGMFALTVMVDPGEKDITIKIPARELVPPADTEVNIEDLPAPVNVAPREDSSEPPVSEQVDESGVKTVAPVAPE